MRTRSFLALGLLFTACAPVAPAPTDGGIDAFADADIDAADTQTMTLRDGPMAQLNHQSAPISLSPGQEITGLCESWSLNNPETIYVNAVTFHSTPGLHHSNWLFVPYSYYSGPDGTWNCSSRGFDEGLAASVGGVLFAQSTQNTNETQQFDPGMAIPIPPYSRIIGNVHLLNVTTSPIAAQLSLSLTTIPADQVTTRLTGLYLEYGPLDIAPHAQSSFTTSCDLNSVHQALLHRPMDFRIYYGLPHYHTLGRSMQVQIVGGPNDGATVFQTNALVGEPWGHAIHPPVDVTGATGLRLTCLYDNPRDTAVHYGVGDQEMCIFLGFTDSPMQWAGIAPIGSTGMPTGTSGTVLTNTAACTQVYGLATHQ